MEAFRQASLIHLMALEEIKAAVEDFERGDANLLEVLDRIKEAMALPEAAHDSRRDAA